MRSSLSVFISVPIEDVFDFLDDPSNTIAYQDEARAHLERLDIAEVRPDGRRVFEAHMRAGPRRWVQTIDQDVRERPTRLLSHSWTWTRDRAVPLATITTERRLSREGDGTRLDMTVEHRIDRPWRHPVAALANLTWLNAAGRLELEHALHFIAEALESRRASATPKSPGT